MRLLLIAFLPCSLSFTLAPTNNRRFHPHVLFETRESDTINEAYGEASEASSIPVTRPSIHWTVPGYKVGWQDDDGNWFDEDGKRNGPPQNFWRQKSDEREYNRDMDALTSVLTEFNVDEVVEALEKRCSIRKRSLSRKLLGSWAPLLLGGDRASLNDKPADDEGIIEVPFQMNIFRTNGRKFAERTFYGLFDAKLEVGEEITVESSTKSFSSTLSVDESNSYVAVGEASFGGVERMLSFGGITYLSDYLLVQRNTKGAIDFWLRCDDAYLGLNEEGDE